MLLCSTVFFFNDTATTEIYTLSLHDALPISRVKARKRRCSSGSLVYRAVRAYSAGQSIRYAGAPPGSCARSTERSEEHTSELQSQSNLVCRLLLEKQSSLPARSLEPSLKVPL